MPPPHCSVCGHAILLNGDRPPPWCPHCGADLKARTSDRPDPPHASTGASGEGSSTQDSWPAYERLPFLVASKLSLLSKDRAEYRIYITATDLLVIKLD